MTDHAADRPYARRGRTALLAVTVALGVATLGGCGGSSSSNSTSSAASAPATTATTTTTTSSTGASTTPSTSTTGGSKLALSAAPGGQLEYNTKTLTANAGKVTIDFTNMSPLGHNVTIENSAGKTLGATPTFQGGTKTLSLDLKPGTYKFFCSVPGHREAGMEGTLIVK